MSERSCGHVRFYEQHEQTAKRVIADRDAVGVTLPCDRCGAFMNIAYDSRRDVASVMEVDADGFLVTETSGVAPLLRFTPADWRAMMGGDKTGAVDPSSLGGAAWGVRSESQSLRAKAARVRRRGGRRRVR